MKSSLNRARWAALPLAALAACSAFAQSGAPSPTLVVTATRTATPLTEVLSDVSVVERDAIERSGATSVAGVLALLPGVTMSQTGGPASVTGVFMRGADSRFTAVFVDGVRIDSQSTGGAAWELIPLAQVERIEVLRGPAAAIYGSDAVAGVVQIFTREGEAGLHPLVRVGVGSYNTRDASVSLRGGSGDVRYALGLADERSDGFNAQPNGTNPDRDGYRNRSFSGRLDWRFLPGQKLELTVLDNDQRAGYDAWGSRPPVNDLALHRLQTLGLTWSARWSDVWSTRAGITRGTDRYETQPSPYQTETQVSTYLLRNEWRSGVALVSVDLERREDDLQNASTTPNRTQRSQNALALGYGLRSGAHSLQLNGRRDDDSEFGAQHTGAVAYGYAFGPAWRLSASSGTAFRAPNLYQRFSIYGSAGLKAETSSNHELALRWREGDSQASLVSFRNTVDNLIDYVSGPGSCINGSGAYAGCYGNVGHARLSGTTLAGTTVLGLAHLGASLDWLDPRNLSTDKLLARRARQQGKLTADVPLASWRVGAELQHVGQRFDNAGNTVRLASYTLLNLSASRQLDRDWRLLAKVSNLSDTQYTLANGYATAGRSVYLGLSWAPRSSGG